tara:strand:+ start:5923 stop:6666 length:744 start_codon:yes stop_codon:yes gene_type:complete
MQSHDDYIVVIPARYDSSRLPGKPLIKISGIEMLLRTFNRCKEVVDAKKIFVATDNLMIEDFCISNNIQVVMTSDKCLTGTDRVAEVSKKIYAPVYINVQGDEPILNPKDLLDLINQSLDDPSSIFNGYCQIEDESQYFSKNIPKVIFAENKDLLYMSRAAIPFSKSGDFKMSYRQVCIYGFPREALAIFSKNKEKTFFEMNEDIEILRFLELGCKIKMIEMSSDSVAVDIPDDILKVEKILKLENG